MLGFGNEAKNRKVETKASNKAQMNTKTILKKAINYQANGDWKSAENTYREAIERGYYDSSIFTNLGIICKSSGRTDEAIRLYKKAIELRPDNPDAYSNIGNLYREVGNHDKALAFTLKSLEIKPDNPDALINLGLIYQDHGNLDKAIASTLKSLKIRPDNTNAINNLRFFTEQPGFNPSRCKEHMRAYELLLNLTNISHRNLSRIFLKAYLPKIQDASRSESIISEDNKAFQIMATDWRLCKSLTLLIPPDPEVERFFTRVRKELLMHTKQNGTIPEPLKQITEALAAQCYLNEYVYFESKEESDSIKEMIEAANDSQESTNRNLAIIGCYKGIHTTGIRSDFIEKYPTNNYSSRELIKAQFEEPLEEQKIKDSLRTTWRTMNKVSRKVQEMYEENPYPRFRYSDHTSKNLKEPICNSIEKETTRQNLTYPRDLMNLGASPKVLIAGCGTGEQVVLASRYRNAEITAIDLSTSSLAHAIRKTKEYKMKNVIFKKLDLLDIAELGETYSIIECGGVLHHMDKPSEGLSALVKQLTPGGYIKLGLYSEVARKTIVKVRQKIQEIGYKSSPESIREFRNKVLNGEYPEFLDLPKFGIDFYSLSGCRDLCFHIQEHRFTTEGIKELLCAHGLTFSGFMVPQKIKQLYRGKYPKDTDMTSLKNWGEFEQENIRVFAGMYQFWAQKRLTH